MLLALFLFPSVFTLALGYSVPLGKPFANLITREGYANVTTLNTHLHAADFKFGQNTFNIQRTLGVNSSAAYNPRRRKRAGTSAVALISHSSMLWSGALYIGTPPVRFEIDFDTGSGDLVICGSDSCSNGGQRRVYKSASSSTSVGSAVKFFNTYGDGSVTSGLAAADIVQFGSLGVRQTLNIASSLGGVLSTFPADGLLGLAFPPLSSTGATSFVTSLAISHKIPLNEFSFRLSDTPGVSELFVGGYNPSKFTGPISWYPMSVDPRYGNMYTYFQLANAVTNVNGVAVGGTRSLYIIDTGTTLIIAPLAQAQAFWAAVPSAIALTGAWDGYWSYNCGANVFVSFSFNGSTKRHPVASSDFSIGLAPGSTTRCVGALAGGDIGIGAAWIIGDVFLKNTYSIFNVNGKQIGFATPR